MIITNSTPDKHYYEQLIAFLMSIKINSPEHLNIVRVYLANYPDEKEKLLKNAFREVLFINGKLKMTDKRGFATIIDRASRIKRCLQAFDEPVAWIDTDVIVRGDLSPFLEIGARQLKILYREGAPEHVKINAGIFNIGNSKICIKFIDEWHNSIRTNKRWGQGQLYFWRTFRRFRSKIEMVNITKKYNSAGREFNENYVMWHCKKAHFNEPRYQKEYQKYLKTAKELIKKENGGMP